ncbi:MULTISPECIES: SAM-dependent methyltransferase [unclassified Sphingomonas]|uniref:class I SAM-dependent methyltransferase n=1 Tax=unclassified Sphingomonas TaxID=196159 RepID=UPI00092AF5D8|nr:MULTISPECIES: SAM-dependent methyltransferase [unclassified Sphingomonas]OJU17015.1 MAG: methyltransferase [Sphingomonas sp. 66-10]
MTRPTDEAPLPERLARAITLGGPIPVSQFMAAANAHYYATRDPLGAAGDFTTAPEISQMFGELIGLWAADLWDRAGRPADALWVELGPGRGTLTADALRAMRAAGFLPPVHFVETSPVLRAEQAKRVADAVWHDDVEDLPSDRPLIIIANEFFDALPIRQLVRAANGWHERLVACQDVLFLPIAGKQVPDSVIPEGLRDAAPGAIIETSPASVGIMRVLAARIVAQGGALLAIDYGYQGPAIGDTLQAVRGHAFANPFDEPGERDLTAHVDFATLGLVGHASGAIASGPIDQGDLLRALGIDARAAALAQKDPRVLADRDRLVEDMGTLFKALAIRHPDWPQPAGFA